mmetsp:Transcript_2848/g.4690  ORF Transcript_2848/g.4690 Transcript_2848/m.4690 type:complete len:117 (+) Transcript_2848:1796-2146(+)
MAMKEWITSKRSKRQSNCQRLGLWINRSKKGFSAPSLNQIIANLLAITFRWKEEKVISMVEEKLENRQYRRQQVRRQQSTNTMMRMLRQQHKCKDVDDLHIAVISNIFALTVKVGT